MADPARGVGVNATATPHRVIRYRVRTLEFVGEQGYPQGHGMRWDDVVVEVSEGERIVSVEQTFKEGRGFNMLLAVVRVVVMSETNDEATS